MTIIECIGQYRSTLLLMIVMLFLAIYIVDSEEHMSGGETLPVTPPVTAPVGPLDNYVGQHVFFTTTLNNKNYYLAVVPGSAIGTATSSPKPVGCQNYLVLVQDTYILPKSASFGSAIQSNVSKCTAEQVAICQKNLTKSESPPLQNCNTTYPVCSTNLPNYCTWFNVTKTATRYPYLSGIESKGINIITNDLPQYNLVANPNSYTGSTTPANNTLSANSSGFGTNVCCDNPQIQPMASVSCVPYGTGLKIIMGLPITVDNRTIWMDNNIPLLETMVLSACSTTNPASIIPVCLLQNNNSNANALIFNVQLAK
jgi:hypothetical protein